MNIGISMRNMGVQSTPSIMSDIAVRADQAGIESLWVTDHIAIPPDDAEGSGGRYVDPLATLAWIAGQTSQIKLGTGVLILPYRPSLPTAKLIASIQELSGDRLLLGIGIGWMQAEFNAVGKRLQNRGRDSDETLAFLHKCFASDEIESNGQGMLFKPRPARPPIYIGGSAPHAIDRALRYGDGWMPMGRLEKIEPVIADYRSRANELDLPDPEITTFAALDETDLNAALDKVSSYREAGVTRLVIGRQYQIAADWHPTIDLIHQITESRH